MIQICKYMKKKKEIIRAPRNPYVIASRSQVNLKNITLRNMIQILWSDSKVQGL